MDLQTNEVAWMANSSGTWLMLKTKKAAEIASKLSGDLDVTIKKHRGKRSLNANALFWKLAEEVAIRTGKGITEVYREYIKDIGENYSEVVIMSDVLPMLKRMWSEHGLGWIVEVVSQYTDNTMIVRLYYGSSVYDSWQMSRLIDLVIQDCRNLGIPTPEDERIDALIESWEKRNQSNVNIEKG